MSSAPLDQSVGTEAAANPVLLINTDKKGTRPLVLGSQMQKITEVFSVLYCPM